MRIQHNIAALNSYRNLTNNNSAVAKNLEKLSSGYRINRAGDDAAGLAISEKMRAQITGLQTAQKNANDGISLVQTAEGALTEVHSMLNRMVELANQSANGTYADAPDRENLQAEIESLKEEIDRISKATNFNGINLLDGSLGLNTKTFELGATTEAAAAGTVTGADIGVEKTHGKEDIEEVEPGFTIDLADLEVNIKKAAAAADVNIKLEVGGEEVTFLDGTTKKATTPKFQSSTTADASKTAADIATELNGKLAVIGDSVFEITAQAGVNGNSSLKFEYQGMAEAPATAGDAYTITTGVTDKTWTPQGEVKVTVGSGTDAEVTAGRVDCPLTNIADPVVEAKGERAGASLKITQEIIDRGSLVIGDKTFKFDDTKTEAQGTNTGKEVTIGTKGLTGDELIASVTRQLSKQGEIIITKDGAQHKFQIGARNGATDTIEIEEKPVTGTDKLGNFTEAELQGAFSQTQSAKNATNSVTIKDVPKAGDSIKIGDKTYVFGGC